MYVSSEAGRFPAGILLTAPMPRLSYFLRIIAVVVVELNTIFQVMVVVGETLETK